MTSFSFCEYETSNKLLFPQKWKIMSCKMKIEQLKEAVAWGNEEVQSGESSSRPHSCFVFTSVGV